MAKDNSMFGWTPKSLDEKAQKDVAKGRNEPPPSWVPFMNERPGSEARDRYDRAHDYHSNKDKKG